MTDIEIIEPEDVGAALQLRDVQPVTLFRSDDPTEVVERATETAKALTQVLKKQKLTMKIQQKDYVLYEGWALLGSMVGVFASIEWTRKLDNGWEARAVARTLNGAIVGAAEAECLRSERQWASRDDYAIKGMAQTRALSRAYRGPLGFVVHLAGFEPEPAEEMESTEVPTPRSGGRRSPTSSPPKPDAPSASAPEPAVSQPVGTSPTAETSPTEGGSQEAAGSPFQAPTGPRGGQSIMLEAKELADRLVELVNEVGATDSLPKVAEKREAGDVAWLKRQIAMLERAVEARRMAEDES